MRRQLEQISTFEPVTHKSEQVEGQTKKGKQHQHQVNENQDNSEGSEESENSSCDDERDGSPRLKLKLDVKITKRDRCYSLLGPYDTVGDSTSTIVKLYVIKMRTSSDTKAQGSSPFKMGSMPNNFFKMSIDLSRCSPETDNDLELRRFKQLVKEKLNLPDNFRIYNMQGHPIQDFEMSFLSQDDQSRSVVYVSSLAVSFDFETYLKMFKEIRKLGQGGFGQVFLSKHLITHEKYAIKIIQPNIQKADEASKAFKEAQVLQKLDHPNIIKLNNVFQLPDTRIILFMPHLKGGSLNDYLKENGNKVSESTAQSIIAEVANAIQFCHQRSIVHRDIKLENIMLRKRGDLTHGLVIIDFGIAGQLTRNEKQIEGTIRYAPPELLNGKNLTADTSFDVWSLGILLYRLISGAFPFEGKHLSELKLKILNQELAFPSELFTDISDSSLALIKLMLNKQASQRPKLHQLILHPWFQTTKNQQKLMNMTMYKNQQNTLTNFFNHELSNISALRSKRQQDHCSTDDITPVRDLIVIDENLNLDSPLEVPRPHHHQHQHKKSIIKKNYSPSALSRGVQLEAEKFTIVPQKQQRGTAFEGAAGTADGTPTNNIREGGSRYVESALSLQMKKQKLNEKRSFKQEFDSLSVDRKVNMDDRNYNLVSSNITKLKKKKKRIESINHQRNDTYGSGISSIISGASRLMQHDSQRSSVMTQKHQGLSLKPSRIISIGEHQNDLGTYNPLYLEIAQKPHSKFKKQSLVIRNGDLGGSLDKRDRFAAQSSVHRDDIELPMIGSPIKKRHPQINQIIKNITQEIIEASPSSKLQHPTNKGSNLDGAYSKKQSAFLESTFEKSAGAVRNTSNTRLPSKHHHQTPMIKGQVNIVNQNDLASEEPEIIKILEIQQQFIESKQPKAKSPNQRRINEQQEPFVNVKLKLI